MRTAPARGRHLVGSPGGAGGVVRDVLGRNLEVLGKGAPGAARGAIIDIGVAERGEGGLASWR